MLTGKMRSSAAGGPRVSGALANSVFLPFPPLVWWGRLLGTCSCVAQGCGKDPEQDAPGPLGAPHSCVFLSPLPS